VHDNLKGVALNITALAKIGIALDSDSALLRAPQGANAALGRQLD
jgi:hypothetical protein